MVHVVMRHRVLPTKKPVIRKSGRKKFKSGMAGYIDKKVVGNKYSECYRMIWDQKKHKWVNHKLQEYFEGLK